MPKISNIDSIHASCRINSARSGLPKSKMKTNGLGYAGLRGSTEGSKLVVSNANRKKSSFVLPTTKTIKSALA